MKILKTFLTLFILCAHSLFALSYKVTELRPPDWPNSSVKTAYSLNELGQVAGLCYYNKQLYLYVWDEKNGFTFIEEKSLKNLGHSTHSFVGPFLNDKGEVSLTRITNKGNHYFVEGNKLFRNHLEIESSLNWVKTEYIKANNSGQILGSIIEKGKRIPIIYNEFDKSVTYISYGKYPLTEKDINDLGWVVASYRIKGQTHAILWTPEFGSLYLGEFEPIALNNHGVVIGNHLHEAILWNRGILIDLSKEIEKDPTVPFLSITQVKDINDNGQIIGIGDGGVYILLTPKD